MTAKEMFKALDYKQTTNDDGLIQYKSVNDEYGNFIYITFYLGWECYEVGYANIYQVKTDRVVLIRIKEHKAITQQLKELGWI